MRKKQQLKEVINVTPDLVCIMLCINITIVDVKKYLAVSFFSLSPVILKTILTSTSDNIQLARAQSREG